MQISRQFLLKYFNDFIQRMGLLRPSEQGQVYIACSGGADSMFLLWLIKQLGQHNICALHVNYHTSENSKSAQELLESFCLEQEIHLKVLDAPLPLDSANFEQSARSERYAWFSSLVGLDDLLLTGHNLSDSMEWSWMQMLKSSHYRSWLGIPVRNRRIQRPLMCFARHQIRSLVAHFNIPFKDDPSNEDTKFERNRMRNLYLEKFRGDYPSLEKNYVARHNDLAVRYGLFAAQKRSGLLERIRPTLGGVLFILQSDDLSSVQSEITDTIVSLSNKKRGALREQMQKLQLCLKNKKEGPLLFSGGVQAFVFDRAILLLNAEQYERYRLWDEDFAQILLQQKIKGCFWSGNTHGKSPSSFICRFDNSLRGKDFSPRKLPLSLLPLTSIALKKLNIPWQTSFRTQLIKQKRQQRASK